MSETNASPLPVFVYDVFLKDAVKHTQIAPFVRTWARAEVPGKLYQLPTGLPILVEEEPAAAPAAAAPAPAGAPAAPAAPAPAAAPPAKVFGELMGFNQSDRVLALIDAQEGFRPDAPESSRLLRVEREVTVAATGEKVKAWVYVFPKEKFNAKELYAVHAHGGDWRKFVMMPRFDGYEH
ncbi:MAG TPA: gamma-glutamylcyclotransferase family protein [bacterium]|nr:gamma-glutamylcyclotransferase family protein [bacterium]